MVKLSELGNNGVAQHPQHVLVAHGAIGATPEPANQVGVLQHEQHHKCSQAHANNLHANMCGDCPDRLSPSSHSLVLTMSGMHVQGQSSAVQGSHTAGVAAATRAACKAGTEDGAKALLLLSQLPCAQVVSTVMSLVLHDLQSLSEKLGCCQ